MLNLLAFDLGASNGRAILGQLENDKITMTELHRFENNYIVKDGVFYWDLPYLFENLKQGFKAFKAANVGPLHCFGIDTWGVDYGLIGKDGEVLGLPRAYRYSVDADMERVWEKVDFPTQFSRTGIAALNFNTVYQLYRRKTEGDEALAKAETMLMIPDLLGYLLTGEKKSEYTNVTTAMLYNATTRDWDWESIDELGLPRLEKVLGMFPKLKFLGHSQKFWAEIGQCDEVSRNGYPTGKVTPGRVVELMRKYPNLCGDMSAGSGANAMIRDPEFAYAFMEEFQDRLYFGLDICAPQDSGIRVQLGQFLDESMQKGKISYTAYEKISRGNALDLLEK